MKKITRKQFLKAFMLMSERNAWCKKNLAHLPHYAPEPPVPRRLLKISIAAATRMSTQTLRRLWVEDFHHCKWDIKKARKWAAKYYPA